MDTHHKVTQSDINYKAIHSDPADDIKIPDSAKDISSFGRLTSHTPTSVGRKIIACPTEHSHLCYDLWGENSILQYKAEALTTPVKRELKSGAVDILREEGDRVLEEDLGRLIEEIENRGDKIPGIQKKGQISNTASLYKEDMNAYKKANEITKEITKEIKSLIQDGRILDDLDKEEEEQIKSLIEEDNRLVNLNKEQGLEIKSLIEESDRLDNQNKELVKMHKEMHKEQYEEIKRLSETYSNLRIEYEKQKIHFDSIKIKLESKKTPSRRYQSKRSLVRERGATQNEGQSGKEYFESIISQLESIRKQDKVNHLSSQKLTDLTNQLLQIKVDKSTPKDYPKIIKTWFNTVTDFHGKIFSKTEAKSLKLETIAKHSLSIVQKMVTSSILDSPLISWGLIPDLIGNLYLLASSPKVDKKIQHSLFSEVMHLCILFEQKETPPELDNRKAETLKIHLQLLQKISAEPSQTKLELISQIVSKEPNPQYILTLMKMIVKTDDISLFGSMNFLDNIIETIPDTGVISALKTFVKGDDQLPDHLNESENCNILWLRAALAAKQKKFDLSEKLLKQATQHNSHIGLELALLYLEKWPTPNKTQIDTIRKYLLLSETTITELDQYLWRTCMVSVEYLSLTVPEDSVKRKKTSKPHKAAPGKNKATQQKKHTQKKQLALCTQQNMASRHPPSVTETAQTKLSHFTDDPLQPDQTDKSISETETVPIKNKQLPSTHISDYPADGNEPFVHLTSVTKMVRSFVNKYRRRVASKPSPGLSDTQLCDRQFSIIGQKNKKLSVHEAMKRENRNTMIPRILKHIYKCRDLNNLKQEMLAYKVLADKDLRYVLHFDRLLEEMVWTLWHCVNDPQKTGFDATLQEQQHAVETAADMMLTCIEYTIKPDEIVTRGIPLDILFNKICSWVHTPENFNYDDGLQRYMRYTLYCRAGSALGHIFSLNATLTNRPEMAEKSRFCYHQRIQIAPDYEQIRSQYFSSQYFSS